MKPTTFTIERETDGALARLSVCRPFGPHSVRRCMIEVEAEDAKVRITLTTDEARTVATALKAFADSIDPAGCKGGAL